MKAFGLVVVVLAVRTDSHGASSIVDRAGLLSFEPADGQEEKQHPPRMSLARREDVESPAPTRTGVNASLRREPDPEELPEQQRLRAALVQTGEGQGRAKAKAKAQMFPSGGSVLSVAVIFAGVGWCLQQSYKKCCGEDACWYNMNCVKRARREMFGELQSRDIVVVVHRVRSVAVGKAMAVGVLPRRAKDAAKKRPKPSQCPTRTGKSLDGKWEQSLKIHCAQGYSVVQCCLFKHGTLSEDLLAVATINLKEERSSWLRQNFTMLGQKGETFGDICITVKDAKDNSDSEDEDYDYEGLPPRRVTDKTDPGDARDLTPEEPRGRLTQGKSLETLLASVTGPLMMSDKKGTWTNCVFRGEQKRAILVWAWYSADAGRGEKGRLGRIPIASIKSIAVLPKSISDFVVQYSDEKSQPQELILQRVDLERDVWIKNLKRLLVHARSLRRNTLVSQATGATDLGATSGTDVDVGDRKTKGKDSLTLGDTLDAKTVENRRASFTDAGYARRGARSASPRPPEAPESSQPRAGRSASPRSTRNSRASQNRRSDASTNNADSESSPPAKKGLARQPTLSLPTPKHDHDDFSPRHGLASAAETRPRKAGARERSVSFDPREEDSVERSSKGSNPFSGSSSEDEGPRGSRKKRQPDFAD